MIALPFRSSLKPVGRAVFAKKSVKKSAACSEVLFCLIVTKPVAGFVLLYFTKVKILKLASNKTPQNSS